MKYAASLFLIFLLCGFAVAPATRPEFTPYTDAKPILDLLTEILPADLRDAAPESREKVWNEWAIKRDRAIRERLAQGDADSVINFLMFGTSFTKEARLTAADVRQLTQDLSRNAEPAEGSPTRALLQRRESDFLKGLKAPRGNERLDFARRTIEGAGIQLSGPESASKTKSYLEANVRRVLQEQAGYEEAMAEAKRLNNATEEFAEVSKLFKDRGLSLDTSLPPNFAIEETLQEMKETGQLKSHSLRRIGVIGPGLDFTDKHEGFDFYPVQTVQPFAVVDSVRRLGLSGQQGVEVDVLDLSPRVLRHVNRLVAEARRGKPYTIQLPMDPKHEWQPRLVQYWREFGKQLGEGSTGASVPPALKGVAMRGVAIRPEFALSMKAYDIDVVLQRVAFESDSQRFDLLIATNILVYYDTFEQSLAMANIAAMLRPGGFLLTNNLILELPGAKLRSRGHTAVPYSAADAPSRGDTIVRYMRVE